MNATISRYAFRRLTLGASLLTLAALVALSALAPAAWAQSASSSSLSTVVITVPPRPMTAVQGVTTTGADSTLWSSGVPGPQSSSITLPVTSGNSGGGVPPPVTCTPSSTPLTQTANCPRGYQTSVGATTFTQTAAQVTTCPGGSYGAPSTTDTAWTPTPSQACTVPIPGNPPTPVTCSVSCPVFCRVSIAGLIRYSTQYWAGGGGNCPVFGTPTGRVAGNANPPPFACSGTQTYTYTTTGSCP